MRKPIVIAVAVAFALGGLVAALAILVAAADHGGATATDTQPGLERSSGGRSRSDQWGKGKAFHCKAADCGTEVSLYVRAKIGFCNCTTGVADDEELERLSDFDLMGSGTARPGG